MSHNDRNDNHITDAEVIGCRYLGRMYDRQVDDYTNGHIEYEWDLDQAELDDLVFPNNALDNANEIADWSLINRGRIFSIQIGM